MENVRLILIAIIALFFVTQMIRKKISTIIALPCMGFLVAVVATVGTVNGDIIGFFSHPNVFGDLDKVTGEVMLQPGIMKAVIGEGSKMMSSAIVSAIFGATLAVMLKKLGVIEEIVKRIAELAGDKPMVIAISFFLATTMIFAAIGGLGPIILVGTVALPIMMSSGLTPRDAGAIVLLGVSTGGILNAANWATFTTILESTSMSSSEAYSMVVEQSLMIFIVVLIISILFIIFAVKTTAYSKSWAVNVKDNVKKKVSIWLLITPIIPISIIFISTMISKSFSQYEIITPEVAIVVAIIYVAAISGIKNKTQLITGSFVQGVEQVAGAIVLLIGLGILIKGFQYYTVTPLMEPSISWLVGYLQNPWTYVIGFTLASPLVLYRGPLNTFGIGGSIPAIFAASGFSPVATIYALRATGNLQGFGDPTNSQNIWIADFVKVEPSEITKRLLLIGFIMSFIILLVAVITVPNLLLG
ncbi:MAG: hypothetical protein ACRC5R_05570 [Mycoplasmatales bacterium]